MQDLLTSMMGKEVWEFKEGGQHLIDIVTAPYEHLKRVGVSNYINRTRETLYHLTEYVKPQNIVELGTRDGYSTTAFSAGLSGSDGRLHSFDPVWNEQCFTRHNMEECLWTFYEMTGENGYDNLSDTIPSIDILYIDIDPHEGPETEKFMEGYWAKNVRAGGYISLDDTSPYFQRGVDTEMVPKFVGDYEIMNVGIWGVLEVVINFVKKYDEKIEYAFSVFNHSSPGTAIIKLKRGATI